MFNELPYLITLDTLYSKTKTKTNYIDSSISYGMDNSTKNPYLTVIEEFQKYPSLAFTHKDLAYLKNLGNMPINRMVILRRFHENSSPPENLLAYGGKPISTIIGWVKEDESFPSIGFNEEWTTTNKRLDTLLTEMIKTEFGIPMDMLAPVPGWAQGFLMNFYNAMGITDFGKNNKFPFGDPNVLLEAKTRTSSIDVSQGLKSDFSFKFETVYEQKVIGNLDPGMELLSIFNKLLNMGTSDTQYYMNATSGFINELRAATEKNDLSGWINVSKKLVDAFLGAITKSLDSAKNLLKENNPPEDKNAKKEEIKTPTEDKLNSINEVNTGLNVIKGLADTILATTLGKYRWPIRGSIGLMTGMATTPWHVTIGHPFKPFMSINNLMVDKVDVKWGNEMSFNELPKELTANINCTFGRNMGKNEILKYFAQTYVRTYNKK
jgi:hypothetical protein